MEEPAEPEVDSLASEAVMKPLPVFILKVPGAWSQDVPKCPSCRCDFIPYVLPIDPIGFSGVL